MVLNSTLVHSVSTLLCFLYTRLFGICLLLYGRVSGLNAQDWGKNGVEMDKFYPLLDGMVSSSTHKFPSGHRHRFAIAGVSLMGDGRKSCLAMAWQKTTKKISWKGMVEYHVLLVHSR
jgi:hypothetical protein